MAPQYTVPEGETFFSDMKVSFKDVPTGNAPDHKIPTQPFLDAAEHYSKLFLVYESKAFTTVHSDIKGNIDKLRKVFLEFPTDSETIQDLAQAEIKRNPGSKNAKGNLGLFWLLQNLIFSAKSIQKTLETDKEMYACFQEVYGETLKPIHGILAGTAVQTALRLVPYRSAFLPLLGKDQEKLKQQSLDFMTSMNAVIDVLKPFVNNVSAPYIGVKVPKK